MAQHEDRQIRPRQLRLPHAVLVRALRRVFDIACSAAGLAILAPLFGAIATAIKLDDGGPVFYFHSRVGRNLGEFRVVKFRSMAVASAGGSPLTGPRDARVTRVGRFLRKYKLDELPQLWNVLKGQMRLVGVRPQVAQFVHLFGAEYAELLQSPPGITGLASLWFRNEEQLYTTGSVEEQETQYIDKILPMKLAIALEYELARSCISDFEILVRTALGLGCPRIMLTGRILELLCGGPPKPLLETHGAQR